MKWVESAERTPDDIGAEVWVVTIPDLMVLRVGRQAELAEYLGEGEFMLEERGGEVVLGCEIDYWMPLERPEAPPEL